MLDPPGHDCRGEWGHLGPMDFGIRVAQHRGCRSASCAADGVVVHGEPQSLDVGSGEWRYVYFAEPDGNYVALVEPRY